MIGVGGRRASEELDAVIKRERAWLDLAVLRFYTHPGLRHVFPEFLLHVHHAMRTAIPVMEAARARSLELAASCRVAERLVGYWTSHLKAEAGHDEWLLDDMRRLGLDVDALLTTPPDPHVAELMGTLHFWILHTHPVAALAYFYFAERSVPAGPMIDVMASSAGVPSGSLRAFHRHAVIDAAHGRELEEVLDALPLTEKHGELLALSVTTVIRQVERNVERLLARADDAVENGGPLRPYATPPSGSTTPAVTTPDPCGRTES